ncbi:hypothetical protein XELAEV_18011927mg [Xenopus laevis]|uniref:Uncharacterized protein n=1 Tax=Xenopus laevis TaxID=8355 RepID=A0A974DLM7_XENLA|nr:hypothetical protein XELAEV_18011927mg [Xenopus laevis]
MNDAAALCAALLSATSPPSLRPGPSIIRTLRGIHGSELGAGAVSGRRSLCCSGHWVCSARIPIPRKPCCLSLSSSACPFQPPSLPLLFHQLLLPSALTATVLRLTAIQGPHSAPL